MKTSKKWERKSRCPVCGEQLSLFDRTHVREKHPKHFHEVRKWQFGFSLSLAFLGLFLMLDTFYPDELVRIPASIGTLIASGLGFFFAYKWCHAAKRYKMSSIRDRSVSRTPACKPN